jgi:hypothetical protein
MQKKPPDKACYVSITNRSGTGMRLLGDLFFKDKAIEWHRMWYKMHC